jgi:hypothetical protein
MTLTIAQQEALYDAERSGSAWLKAQENTSAVWDEIIAVITDDGSDTERARELQPVPSVPFGYPTDRALIFEHIGDIMVTIDRRDCEMLICQKGEMDGVILTPAFALALAQFLNQPDIRELVAYHRGAGK